MYCLLCADTETGVLSSGTFASLNDAALWLLVLHDAQSQSPEEIEPIDFHFHSTIPPEPELFPFRRHMLKQFNLGPSN